MKAMEVEHKYLKEKDLGEKKLSQLELSRQPTENLQEDWNVGLDWIVRC